MVSEVEVVAAVDSCSGAAIGAEQRGEERQKFLEPNLFFIQCAQEIVAVLQISIQKLHAILVILCLRSG